MQDTKNAETKLNTGVLWLILLILKAYGVAACICFNNAAAEDLGSFA